MKLKPSALLAIGLAGLLACANTDLPTQARTQANEQELKVTANFTGQAPVAPDAPIELRLSRPLQPAEGKLAVFIGPTDVTNLFTVTAGALRYTSKILPLPAGETEVVVYLVSPNNDWKEMARFPLRVADESGAAQDKKGAAEQEQPRDTPQPQATATPQRFGFEKFEITPSLTLSIKSQAAVLYFPDSGRPDRINFTDVTLQGSLQSHLVRGAFSSQGQFDVVAASFQKEALRFGEKGNAAPQIELSSYLMQFQIGKARFQLGHVSYGANRHLINSFSSRGITASFPLGSRADFSFTAMNGANIVGWNNFFGLDRRKHQIQSATVGLEFLKRPRGLRLEASLLNGSLLPLSGFNQGVVNDSERSRGGGLRLLASDPSGRLRLDGGFTRSRFTNPTDPLLDQGASVVPVRATARHARYLDVSYDVVREFSLTKTRKLNATIAYRHERVDPLFRSVAAFAQADRAQNQFELVGGIGEITINLSHFRFNDNLADIPSILKTVTRSSALALGAPLVSLFGDPARPSPWLPRVAYSYDRTRQFGTFAPVNGGFELQPGSVPDQLSTNQTFNAEWQLDRWRFGYRFNHSFQDNRQTGRELVDLKNSVHGLTLGLTPLSILDLNFDLNAERAHNSEIARTDRTLRAGFTFTWRTTQKSALAANLSTAFAGDAAQTSRSRNAEFDLQWSWRFGVGRSRFKKAQAQLFVRYANRYARSEDNLFGFHNLIKSQTASAGLSFTFF